MLRKQFGKNYEFFGKLKKIKMNNLTADLLARLQNGIDRRKETIIVPHTKLNIEILRVLKEEEMIADYRVVDKNIEVDAIYTDKEPTVSHFDMVSKPGQRIYVTSKEIVPIMNGRGISIISTSQGLMTGSSAKSKKIGGELICKVW